jgi:hypothetical protein
MTGSRRFVFLSIVLSVFCGVASAQRTVTVPESVVAYPEMILYNGKVVTMDDTSFGLNTQVGRVVQAIAVGREKSRPWEAMTKFWPWRGRGPTRSTSKGAW